MKRQPLFTPPVAPTLLERLVIFRDHTEPPATREECIEEVRELQSWGASDVVCGVTNCRGSSPRLLAPEDDPGEASALRAWRLFGEVCTKVGIRLHGSLWHKPAWHRALLALSARFDAAMQGVCASVMWDIEGETFGPKITFDDSRAAAQIEALNLNAPFAVTIQPWHVRKAAPYLKISSWCLLQVLSFQDDAKHIGTSNPWSMPGLWQEEVLDDIEGRWSWVERGGCQIVLLLPAYKQDWKGVSYEDAFAVSLAPALQRGRREIGLFSAMHLRKGGGKDLAKDAQGRVDRGLRAHVGITDAMRAGADTEDAAAGIVAETIAFEDALDLLSVPTSRVPYMELATEEAARVYRTLGRVYAGRDWSFESREFGVLMTAVRSMSRIAGQYDDRLYMLWLRGGVIHGEVFAFNCDPSPKYLRRPVRQAQNRGGTAALVHPQQVCGYYHAKHMGKTLGLCQYRKTDKVRVWRDGNKDDVLDYDTCPEDVGHFGINWHIGGRKDVGSAGCLTWPPQVHKLVNRRLRQHSSRYGRINAAIISEEDLE